MTENEMLRRELQAVGQYRGDAAAPPQQAPAPPPGQPPQGSYPPDQHYAPSNRTELPPLRSISNSIPAGPESMTGVQYETNGGANGYRQDRY